MILQNNTTETIYGVIPGATIYLNENMTVLIEKLKEDGLVEYVEQENQETTNTPGLEQQILEQQTELTELTEQINQQEQTEEKEEEQENQ